MNNLVHTNTWKTRILPHSSICCNMRVFPEFAGKWVFFSWYLREKGSFLKSQASRKGLNFGAFEKACLSKPDEGEHDRKHVDHLQQTRKRKRKVKKSKGENSKSKREKNEHLRVAAVSPYVWLIRKSFLGWKLILLKKMRKLLIKKTMKSSTFLNWNLDFIWMH